MLTNYVLIICIAYLLGTSNMALYLSKLNGVNLREGGSKNLGASNALIMMGKKAGIIVGIHDFAKAIIAVLIARYLFQDLVYGQYVAGSASVIGHIFPFYLKFKGGKGFASFLGMTIAFNYKFALCLLLAVLIILLVTDYIVIGTMTSILVVPIFFGYITQDPYVFGILAIASLLILYKHRENFIRLKNGEEIGFRKANKKS